MSSITSIAGYNGKGTQGLVATDKLDDNTRSVFWNENDTNKTLLYGAAIVEVNSGGIDKPGSNKSWTFDNDPDVISDIYLRITIPLDQYISGIQNIIVGNIQDFSFSGFSGMGVLNIIDRIDLKVGNQIWHTVDRFSLYSNILTKKTARNITDTLQGKYVKSHTNSKVNYSSSSIALQDDLYVDCMIPLELITSSIKQYDASLTKINETGHIFCAAPDQQFTVQIYFSDGKFSSNNSPANGELFTGVSGSYRDFDTKIFNTSLYYKQINVCNLERKLLTENSLAKRFKTTQYISNIKLSEDLIKVDCSHFNIYGSYLLVYCNQSNNFLNSISSGSSINNAVPSRPSFDFNLKINNVSIGYFTDILLFYSGGDMQNQKMNYLKTHMIIKNF